MTNRLLTALLAAALLPAAGAPLTAAEGPPTPAAEMANLQIFDGSWTCDGQVPAGPMGPGGTIRSTVVSQSDLGGFWQTGTVNSSGAGMPGAMEGRFHMTYDVAAKQYVLLWVDNMGAWSQATSSGWQGDTMVFTGTSSMGGQKANVRDTFRKGADGALRHDWEAEIDGTWTSMGTEICRKTA